MRATCRGLLGRPLAGRKAPTIGSSYAGEELPCEALPQPAAFLENVKRRNYLLGSCRCRIELTHVGQGQKPWQQSPKQTKYEPLKTSVNGTELETVTQGSSELPTSGHPLRISPAL